MPLVALDQDGQRVDITKYSDPREQLRGHSFVCQACGTSMILKAGLIVCAHFAHKPGSECGYFSHPETIEHLQAKAFIASHLKEWWKEYSESEPELEVPIREIKRIADIVFRFSGGWEIVHEVQLASITTLELQQRTDDYLRAGMDTFWWLGGSANTRSNQAWCESIFGFSLEINFTKNRESFHYSAPPST